HGRDEHTLDIFYIASHVPEIPHVHGIPFPPLDRSREVHSADGGLYDLLYVLHSKAVAGSCLPVNIYVEEIAGCDAFGIGTARARDLLYQLLYFNTEALDLGKIGAQYLDAYRSPDACRKHIYPVFYRHCKGIGYTWNGERVVHFEL